jgi:hypothetical protein
MQTNPIAKRTAEMTVSPPVAATPRRVYTIKIETKEMQSKTLTQFACDLNMPLPALIEWNGGMSHVSPTCQLKRRALLTVPMIGPKNPQSLPPADDNPPASRAARQRAAPAGHSPYPLRPGARPRRGPP